MAAPEPAPPAGTVPRHPYVSVDLSNPAATAIWVCAVVSKALKEAGVHPKGYWADGQPWTDMTAAQAIAHARTWVRVTA